MGILISGVLLGENEELINVVLSLRNPVSMIYLTYSGARVCDWQIEEKDEQVPNINIQVVLSGKKITRQAFLINI